MSDLTELLQAEQAFISDGAILKNAVIEAALNMDVRLLELLMQSDTIKDHFFTPVAGALVFDKVKFQEFVSNKAFLPDSYTTFKNRIGLTDGRGDYISQSRDVVLAWPYKDCVLEGGMTKEDRGRNEVFWNTTLAPDDITRLFEPKVLTGWERWDGEAVLAGKAKPVGEVSEYDNLLIKGNNLLALHSLKARYAGEVKLIYIDPPYNTGNDGFRYNDRFNHSAWLTFMRNRLEVARDLLSRDGFFCCQADDNEGHYLRVLMDEVFGAENYLSTLYVQVRYADKTLTQDMDFHKQIEMVHLYRRTEVAKPILPTKQKDLEKYVWYFAEKAGGTEMELGGKRVIKFSPNEIQLKKGSPSEDGRKEIWATGSILDGNSSGRFFRDYLQGRSAQDGLGAVYKVFDIGSDDHDYRYFTGPKRDGATKGKYFQGVPSDQLENADATSTTPIENFKDMAGSFGNCRGEGGVELRSGKKPEALVRFLLDHLTVKGDLVLDSFAGSGTTAAVAHKMGRRWITTEQLDYITGLPMPRLTNVIAGDATGISEQVEWQGGGSFVYAELAASNSSFADRIEAAQDIATLQTIHADIQATGYLRYDVDLSSFETDDFAALPLDDAKRVLMDCLDANHLYVNLGSLDDADFDISEEDITATRSFYGLGK
ncbi:DNA methyltransferase [Pseudahrensia aquimaris]|uniref:site-specific DNA-methyltransferase (adenine-specific) n=1 Tax=Pseudahrensia aquimaris TaxID=744461 RepID=A0ABW3F908_9HYPH